MRLVLDRIGELLKAIDPDPSESDRLQKLLEEREATERANLKASGIEPGGPRERGHLRLGRIPELLKKASDAVASKKPEQSNREVLRGPLLDLRDEIDRIHRVPRAPREYLGIPGAVRKPLLCARRLKG